MAKFVALVALVLAALVALVSSQYFGHPYAGRAYHGAPLLARGAYAAHPYGGLGYAHAGYPGYLGYGARGVVYG